jgi:hypothetical protein
MNKHSKGSEYMTENFPKLSDIKLKDRIFIGPQIREIINDDILEHLLTKTEEFSWRTFKAVFLNFLENPKAENYKELVEDLKYIPDCGL